MYKLDILIYIFFLYIIIYMLNINDDFYNYVNYKWLNNNIIPDDEIDLNNFTELQKKIYDIIENIIKLNIFNPATKLYNSYIDMEYRNLSSINELKKVITITENIKNYDDLINIATILLFINVDTLFKIDIDNNIFLKNETIIFLSQPKLGLQKEYYLNKNFINIKQKYYDTICQLYIELYPDMNIKDINILVTTILNIETKLSIILLNNIELNDISNNYKQISVDEFIKKYSINIKNIFNILIKLSENNIKDINKLIVISHNNFEYDYFNQLTILLNLFTLDEWKLYFNFKIILKYMHLLNNNIVNLHHNLFSQTINGQISIKKINKLATMFTANMFSEKISYIFYDLFKINNNNDIITYIKDMIKTISKIIKKRILKLTWMTEETKYKAIEKINNIKLKIGYNNNRIKRKYKLNITNSIINNTLMLNIDKMYHNLNKLNLKKNDEWDISSFVVNAYYSFENTIIFPIAILNKPFIDINQSAIYNYSAIGTIIAHEIIHSVDDNGSLFNKDGIIENWWNKTDYKEYKKKINKIVDIYNNENANGLLTVGENIADFAETSISLNALENKLGYKLNNNELQEFFINYAKCFRSIERNDYKENSKDINTHAPFNVRVNTILKYQKVFQKTFCIKETDKMYIKSENFINIW